MNYFNAKANNHNAADQDDTPMSETTKQNNRQDISTVSIVVPCYNEEATLEKLVRRVMAADSSGLDIELVIVDDCSKDRSFEIATQLAELDPRIKAIRHTANTGKGGALRTGFANTSGDIVMVQDADLEYSPDDYPLLFEPILNGRADVVYGSRFKNELPADARYMRHVIANKFLTILSNIFSGLRLTDMETCYKVFKGDIIRGLALQENRFGIEPEMTAKIAAHPARPMVEEVGISYQGRTYEEGKKIGWKDGVSAIRCIVRYNLFK
ncbi:MAG: glycosyltransferase family 2 protein [Rhodospirillaceae bacterium]|nr:glycosyltransferase family 2 protein [Rhodospirillaceae bacterium]